MAPGIGSRSDTHRSHPTQGIYESRDHGGCIDATEKTCLCGHGRGRSDPRADRRAPSRARLRKNCKVDSFPNPWGMMRV
jgi:hypothetical protein